MPSDNKTVYINSSDVALYDKLRENGDWPKGEDLLAAVECTVSDEKGFVLGLSERRMALARYTDESGTRIELESLAYRQLQSVKLTLPVDITATIRPNISLDIEVRGVAGSIHVEFASRGSPIGTPYDAHEDAKKVHDLLLSRYL